MRTPASATRSTPAIMRRVPARGLWSTLIPSAAHAGPSSSRASCGRVRAVFLVVGGPIPPASAAGAAAGCLADRRGRSEEHTSELQSRGHLVCRLLLEKKNNTSRYSEEQTQPDRSP